MSGSVIRSCGNVNLTRCFAICLTSITRSARRPGAPPRSPGCSLRYTRRGACRDALSRREGVLEGRDVGLDVQRLRQRVRYSLLRLEAGARDECDYQLVLV